MHCQKHVSKFSYFSGKPISEIGNDSLDKIIFIWALNALQPLIKYEDASACFARMKSSYDDEARFFHRGLGHPRQLIPQLAEQAYRKLPDIDESILDDKTTIAFLIDQFDHLIPREHKTAVAQEILGAFYHDVVHRKGHYHEVLLPFATEEKGYYRIDPIATPLTSALLAKDTTKTVEEISCLVAEIELSNLGVEEKLIIPILMATYCTIPFSDFSDEGQFNKLLTSVINTRGLDILAPERKHIYSVAIGVANRDKGSYGSDTLNEFNIKTWGMIFERNPMILQGCYTLNDLAITFQEFYSFHKNLFKEIIEEKKQIFYGSELEAEKITILNRNALRTLQLDIELHGLLLATVIVTMQLLKERMMPHDAMLDNKESALILKEYIEAHLDKEEPEFIGSLPSEIITVLKQQGKETSVNGHHFVRGSDLTSLTFDLVKCFGAKKLLQIADNYPETELSLTEYMDNKTKTI